MKATRLPVPGPADPHADELIRKRSQALWVAALLVLGPVAGIGACLSFQSLHRAAKPIFGPLAVGYPLLVDMLILGSTLAYLAGAVRGRGRAGWRWAAHTGVAGTLALNCLSASNLATMPWHIAPPLMWAILVEMTARQVSASWRLADQQRAQPIPVRLWCTRPLDSTRTWLHMAATGQPSHRRARADLALQAGIHHVLNNALPGLGRRGIRRLVRRQLRAGVLEPADVLRLVLKLRREPGRLPTDAVIAGLLAEAVHAHNDPSKSCATSTALERFAQPASAAQVSDPEPSWAEGFQDEESHEVAPQEPPSVPQARGPEETVDSKDDNTKRGTAATRPTPGTLANRTRAVEEILDLRPAIDGPALVAELAGRGWRISERTARRILNGRTRSLSRLSPQTSPARP